MKNVKMIIELVSDTLPGSGEGFGAVIDTDVQYDENGIPFISSKRIKGILRNSLYDLLDMPAVKRATGLTDEKAIEEFLDSIFGKKGSALPSSFEISDFFIEDYENVKQWFEYLKHNYPSIFSNEKILSTFTNIRRQTKIDDKGIAEKHSLRTLRVLNKLLKLQAQISFEETGNKYEKYLALACANLRRIGIKRNRGLGEVKCWLDGISIEDAIDSLKKDMEKI